jgi:hypothetical protein
MRELAKALHTNFIFSGDLDISSNVLAHLPDFFGVQNYAWDKLWLRHGTCERCFPVPIARQLPGKPSSWIDEV